MGLGSEARMNVPGVATGNWVWRYSEKQLAPATAERMAALCDVSERVVSSDPARTKRRRSRSR
jgi:4-alpha-glucanotransferase